jgi:dTMP kinase
MPDTEAARPAVRGHFIVLEGIDGAGTTTQAAALREHLRARGQRAFFTHEPSDGPVGLLIRVGLQGRVVVANNLLQAPGVAAAPGGANFDPAALALLFAADRADHLASQLRPNLAAGRTVVCDRYLLSTLAYQGMNADEGWLVEINSTAIIPDLTLFLDVPPDQAGARMRGSRWKKDIFETDEQQRSIRSRYLELIGRKLPCVGPVEVIDASRPPEVVSSQLIARVDTLLASAPGDAGS